MGALMSSKNADAKLFQRFMNAYGSVSGENRYSGSLEKIKDANAVVVLGTRIATDSPAVYDALKTTVENNNAKVVYAHPIEDVAMQGIATQFMKYEPGSEEGVLALLAYYVLADAELAQEQREFLEDLDLAYLEAESNTGEEEFEEMIELFANSDKKVLIVGDDLMAHDRAENMARLCGLIEKNSQFSLYVVSNDNNTITASLDSEIEATLEEIEELPEFNGTVIYHSNPLVESDNTLRGSAQFARAAKISDGDFISISFGGQTINREFKVEQELKGTIALNPTFDIAVDVERYKFERSEINKINQNSESDNE